jgi:1-acyl-sn-glycerol-3-phosphate acyltransferase
MYFIKSIIGRILAFWALAWFVSTMLIMVWPMIIFTTFEEPKRTRAFWKLSRAWMKFFFFMTGLRLKVKGKDNFQQHEPCIVVCNHNTIMDVPVSTPFIPGPNKTIAKIEMSRIPLFSIIYRLGSVLVDRKDEESRRASFNAMKNVLASGLNMCIYPEGTRNRTDEPLRYFHDGAFRLSAETGRPVIPALIFFTSKVLPRRKFFFWPHRIEIHFLPAIAPGNLSATELKEKIFILMKDYYTGNHQ